MTLLSRNAYKTWIVSGLLLMFAAHEAAAWGPRSRKVIAMASLQIIRRTYNDAFKANQTSYDQELLAGAEDGYGKIRESLPMHDDTQAVAALFQEIQLMRTVRQYGTGSYFAYRMGALSSLAAALVVPYGVPQSEADKATGEKIAADLDAMVNTFTINPRPDSLHYIRTADAYFRDKRMFYADDRKIIADDYRTGRNRRGFLNEAAGTYFERAITVATDSWYTVFRARGETSDLTLSPIIVAEYFVDEIEFLLTKKKNIRQASRAYDVFRDINPASNIEAFETIGDLFYAYGQEMSDSDARERAVREWKIAYGTPGPQKRRASKKLSNHYIELGEAFYRKSQGGNAHEDDLKDALRAFNDALEFDRTSEVAATSITQTTKAIKDRNDRYNMQLSILNTAMLGVQEAERAALAEDYANALITYGSVLNSLGVVDSEFKDLEKTRDDQLSSTKKAREQIYEDVLDRAEQFIAQGDLSVEERRFDDAIGMYSNVAVVLNTIPTEDGTIWANRKQKIIDQGRDKVAEANDAKARYQQDQAAPAAGGGGGGPAIPPPN